MGSNPISSDLLFLLNLKYSISFMFISKNSQITINKLKRIVDLIVPAQTAKMGPPVGPALGQVKIKIKDFCNEFNQATSIYDVDFPLKVIVYVYDDESFHFLVQLPSISFLLKHYIFSEKKNQNIILKHNIKKIIDLKIQEYERTGKTAQMAINDIYSNIKFYKFYVQP